MIGLLHPQVTSHEVTAGKCPSGTIWSPAYSHGFVETSFRRPICRCGVPWGWPPPGWGCPLREAGSHADISRWHRGHSPPECGQCVRATRWTLVPRLRSGTRGLPVCACPGLLAETLTFWVSAGPPAFPVGVTWLLSKVKNWDVQDTQAAAGSYLCVAAVLRVLLADR